ncbi:GNAT family N-acetyltransferase [candidate division WOR-3 bacterium]|nr:GNAT family N-acetyltransferase [candidate division WOR-3 bacterium]
MQMIASGQRTILRDGLHSDLECYMSWMTQGRWLQYDAPWETDHGSPDAASERFLTNFLQCQSSPRKRAIICPKDHRERPIGWVNRYGDKRLPGAWLIGIDICEDAYLNKGHGTEALRLWVDYLFLNSKIHRLGFDTHSFNVRMVRVGEKLGFALEGTEREVIYWHDAWIARLHFGLLRSEWASARQKGP